MKIRLDHNGPGARRRGFRVTLRKGKGAGYGNGWTAYVTWRFHSAGRSAHQWHKLVGLRVGATRNANHVPIPVGF